MRSTEIGRALDGFRSALVQAQRNRILADREQSLRELNTARIAEAEARARAINTPFDAINTLADQVGASRVAGTPFDFSTADPAAVMALEDPERITPFLATDNDRAMALVAAGKPLGVNEAVSIADREDVAARNQANEIAEVFAKPVTTGAGATTTLGVGDPRGETVQGVPTFATARGDIVSRMATGQSVPPAAAATVLPSSGTANADGSTSFGPTIFGATGEAVPISGVSKSGANNLALQTAALVAFEKNVGRAIDMINADPTIVGAVGNVRRLGQSALGNIDALTQAFGYEALEPAFENARARLTRAGIVDPDLYDPRLPQIDQLGLLLAYQGAEAVANQSGRGLSDNDFRRFREIIGNPSGWAATGPNIVARLEQVQQLTRDLVNRNTAINAPGAPTPFDTTPADVTAGQPAAPKRRRYNPATGQFEDVQ